ncbi:MAG: response regulator, partial [Bacteroidales bacterium]|nr:response regulator [Bacteroidales bacterium]
MRSVQKTRKNKMETMKKRIYVADDDDNIRQVVKTFLTSDGYEVSDFPTGDLLLERFQAESCDLVILDV